MEYITPTRVNIHYEIPLSEIVYDFFDKLKSYTKGYASFDYELIGYKESDLVKMGFDINKSETEIMYENHYFKCFDSGNFLFELIP